MKFNKFDENASANGTFQRFQWVVPKTLARSSQPNYNGHDGPHSIGEAELGVLRVEQIRLVVSANSCQLDEASKQRLKNGGIEYHHFPVPDFTAHTKKQLSKAAKLISKHPPALVFCGYGQGRTGTIVAAWALQTGKMPTRTDAFLKEFFGVETAEQCAVLLGR